MPPELSELEQAFRQSWHGFAPQRYTEFLDRVSPDHRLELLTRILSAELEFAFTPPAIQTDRRGGFDRDLTASNPAVAQAPSLYPGTTDANDADKQGADDDDDDDQRVKPCVPLFLLRFPELTQRAELVIRLIVLEYALRLRYDSRPPNPESYLPLCHQQTDQLIRLLELTENKLPLHRAQPVVAEAVKHSDSTVKEASLSASLAIDPLPLNLGCFLLVRLLGRGGMGYVHAALDLRSTAQVAVKVMRRIDAWSIFRFIEEFRWLSQLSHPNLVKLYDAFCEGDVRYFSMELVEGKTIRDWFRQQSAHRDSSWSELRKVLGQLASAIEYLHQHQVVHCDIKCSNMMIAAGHRAVLLDLGLAVRAGQDNRLVGTLQYMAPEVIRGGAASYASDWYSFGVMIYEVLTDAFPPIQIEVSQTEQPANGYRLDQEQLRHKLREAPADLTELCLDLLQTDPGDRPLGAQVVERLKGIALRRRVLNFPPECRGRETEVTAIDLAMRSGCQSESDAQNEPRVVVLEGESGSGKSSLISHWSQGLDAEQYLLLSVRCYRQDHTPVRLLNALVQELTAAVPRLPESCWKPSLVRQAAEIRLLFPQLQQLLPESLPQSSTRSEASRTEASSQSLPAPRTIKATRLLPRPSENELDVSLTSFLQWLLDLSHCQPVLICVDDAQWADHESLRALKRLLHRPSGFRGSLLLVDESGEQRLREYFEAAEPVLGGTSTACPVAHIQLAPLSREICLQLIDDWAQRVDIPLVGTVASDIVTRSSGNPFLLQEIFRTYVHHMECGDSSDAEWLLADSQSSVRRRFSLLPQPAENILQFLAVAEHALGFHQLQMASRILPHELQRTLSMLASQGWIRSRASELESAVEIAHENFRKAIELSIPPDRLQRRHYRLARVLSCETPPPWARIAEHYWAAQHFREAASCYLEAAQVAMSTGGAAEAIDFLQRAEHPDARRSPSEQQRVTRLKADGLARVGSSQAAAELYDYLLAYALQSAQVDEAQATVLRCLCGEQRIRAGQLEAGLARLELALKQLGISSWKKSRFSQWCLALRTLYVGLRRPVMSHPDNGHTASKRPNASTPQANHAPAHRQPLSEVEHILNRLSPSLTFLDNELGPDVILRMERLTNRRGSDFDRALALLRSAVLLSFAGKRQKRQALYRMWLGRKLAKSSRSDEALATFHLSMFVWYLQRGRLARAAKRGQDALTLYRSCAANTQWEQQFLQWATLDVSWYRGELQELRHSTTALRQSAHDRSDPMSLFWMHVAAAHKADLVINAAEQARISLDIASQAIVSHSFESPRFFLWLSNVHQALFENDPLTAMQLLHRDWNQLAAALITRTNHYRWLALNARLCCNLMALRQQLPDAEGYRRDTWKCLRRLQRLQEPAFAMYAQAFRLVFEASYTHKPPPPAAWQTTIEQFHNFEHHLLAMALQWHYALQAPNELREQLTQQARERFEHHGCVAPERLMNIILPLPIRQDSTPLHASL